MHSQTTLSTYMYPLYVTEKNTKTKTQYLNVNQGCFFYIGHSRFNIRCEVGYLMDTRNIQYSKFDIPIFFK